MKILNERLEMADLKKIKPHPKNARKGDVELLGNLIEVNGFYGALVVQRSTGHILVGNHRYKAALEKGAKQLPVLYVDVDDDRAQRILAGDNRSNDLAGYDDQLLAELLGDIQAMLGTGFDDDDYRALLGDEGKKGRTDPDDVPEPPKKAVTKKGDLWHLGPHRLLCGDSTEPADVGRLLADGSPGLMVTDPPYGVDYDPTWRKDAADRGAIGFSPSALGKVENDTRADWSEAWALFPGAVVYVWHGAFFSGLVAKSLASSGFQMRAQVIWRKPSFAISRGHYNWQHETCWYGVRKGSAARFIGSKSETTVWEAGRAEANEHGTQKPVEIMERPMRNHKSEEVYDPFLGSGTSLIAAHRVGRICYGMEISPRYCDVVVERWQDFTGEKAKRARG